VTLAMTTVCPRCFCSCCPNGRKIASVSPPAAHGTMSFTGRSGYAARAAAAAATIATSNVMTMNGRRIVSLLGKNCADDNTL